MSEGIELKRAAQLLAGQDRVLILMHKNPDGDTLGSGYALCAALRKLGKQADAVCDSNIPERYAYMSKPVEPAGFEPLYRVAVDVADANLLGDAYRETEVDLCIDHHASNSGFAKYLYCDPESASTSEIIAGLIDLLGVPFDIHMANCVYTGIATDTGCFRYSNTTSDSFRTAARMIDLGVDFAELNRDLFEIKSRGRVELEQLAISGMEYAHGGKIAIMTISQDMLRFTRVDPGDIEGIASMPRNIEGVEAGVTFRQQKNGDYKISLRTVSIDAAAVCAAFGGGGHKRAAGFECSGSQFDIKVALINEIEKVL